MTEIRLRSSLKRKIFDFFHVKRLELDRLIHHARDEINIAIVMRDERAARDCISPARSTIRKRSPDDSVAGLVIVCERNDARSLCGDSLDGLCDFLNLHGL